MALHPRPCLPASDSPSYPSVDPDTDLRWRFAGSKWNAPGAYRFPMRTALGEWMIPVMIDLPYSMLASLEAAAQSEKIGGIVRAALVAIGHGTPDNIAGVRSDRFATLDERHESVGTTRL